MKENIFFKPQIWPIDINKYRMKKCHFTKIREIRDRKIVLNMQNNAKFEVLRIFYPRLWQQNIWLYNDFFARTNEVYSLILG